MAREQYLSLLFGEFGRQYCCAVANWLNLKAKLALSLGIQHKFIK